MTEDMLMERQAALAALGSHPVWHSAECVAFDVCLQFVCCSCSTTSTKRQSVKLNAETSGAKPNRHGAANG